MHVPVNVKSPNNISKWQMGFNSAFKGLNCFAIPLLFYVVSATAETHHISCDELSDSLLISVHALCYRPSCRNCFHLAIFNL
jgi:hypothetical protein